MNRATSFVALVMSMFVGCFLTNAAWGQNNNNNNNNRGGQAVAGVDVDASGVLRMKVIADPTGKLTRERMEAGAAKLDRNLVRPSELRKISLNRLEAAIQKKLEQKEPVTEEMKYLAGLTRLQHVFYFPESKDIVIAGPAEGFAADPAGRVIGVHSGRSVLELQDLIVALRAFAPSGRQNTMISVSIDPTPEGLAQMQQFLGSLRGITPGDATRIATGLRQSLGQQVVSIRGISPRTHFAQVLVEADYRMKLIGIGLEVPTVKIESYVSRANPSDVRRNAMERWYFEPNYDCVRVTEDRQGMELVGDGVKLVGENERVTAEGGRVNAGAVNKASQAFVQQFTAKYGELARRSPVYAQLRNLIDMAIASAYIQQQDFYGLAEWRLGVFADEAAFPVEVYTTPTKVESAVNVVWKGNTLLTPIGGGVNIQARNALSSGHLQVDEQGNVQKTKQTVKLDNLSAGQWWWD